MSDRPLLALETATPTGRVAVVAPSGAVLAARERVAPRHSSHLLSLCDEALRAAGITVGELAAIACGSGPGSFTGLRVGMAVAKGLALPADLPLVLVPSLETLAHDLAALRPAAHVAPCIDAGKGQVHAQIHAALQGSLTATSDLLTETPEALGDALAALGPDLLVGGNGADRYLALLQDRLGAAAVQAGVAGPSAITAGRLAWGRLSRGQHDDLASAVPTYGRPPDITRPRPR